MRCRTLKVSYPYFTIGLLDHMLKSSQLGSSLRELEANFKLLSKEENAERTIKTRRNIRLTSFLTYYCLQMSLHFKRDIIQPCTLNSKVLLLSSVFKVMSEEAAILPRNFQAGKMMIQSVSFSYLPNMNVVLRCKFQSILSVPSNL